MDSVLGGRFAHVDKEDVFYFCLSNAKCSIELGLRFCQSFFFFLSQRLTQRSCLCEIRGSRPSNWNTWSRDFSVQFHNQKNLEVLINVYGEDLSHLVSFLLILCCVSYSALPSHPQHYYVSRSRWYRDHVGYRKEKATAVCQHDSARRPCLSGVSGKVSTKGHPPQISADCYIYQSSQE